MAQTANPFEVFTGTDGQPLEDGYLYFGVANQNPQTNPIAIYWDEQETIPAANPVRTINGYPSNNGSPGNIFLTGDYSLIVRDANGQLVFSRLSNVVTTSTITNGPYLMDNVAGVDSITGDADPLITAYFDGLNLQFVAVGNNTGPVTLNVNGIGVVNLTKNGSDALVADDIVNGALITVCYSGTGFQLVAQRPNEVATEAIQSQSLAIANTTYADRAAGFALNQIAATVANNALTVTMEKGYIDFRSTTANAGAITRVQVSSQLTITAPSGASFGSANNINFRIFVLAINNAGTVEFALANAYGGLLFDESATINTTAIGVGSTSATTIYSTSARSGVAFRIVGFIDIAEATAGVYATAPTSVQGIGSSEFRRSNLFGGTIQATTTGSSYDFTGIPAWARRVTIVLQAVSINAANDIFVRLGTSGGVDASGYSGQMTKIENGATLSIRTSTTEFIVFVSGATGDQACGRIVIEKTSDNANTWVITSQVGANQSGVSNSVCMGTGVKSMSSNLDRVRFGTVATFDLGAVRFFIE